MSGKKVVSRNVAIALGVIIIILVVGIVGACIHMLNHPVETVPGLTGTLTVTVEDATTSAPISNVEVKLLEADTGDLRGGGLTDGGGITFGGIPAMRYTITAAKSGYSTAKVTVDVPPTENIIIFISSE